jgi:hypothetical protein
MSSIAVALLVFTCALAGVAIGMLLRRVLPDHHLSEDSKDVVKLGIGMVATMTALILGLMIASAKSAFDARDAAVKHVAASVLALDRSLADYGPETAAIRETLRRALAERLEETWPEEASKQASLEPSSATYSTEGIAKQIAELTPRNAAQTWFQSRALELAADVLQTRWTVFGDASSSVSPLLLAAVILWLTVIFASFGMFAPRNATVIVMLIVCALSVSASVFLIMDMDRPLEGWMKISSAPVRFTLEHLGR